jgi:hypothetical protein
MLLERVLVSRGSLSPPSGDHPIRGGPYFRQLKRIEGLLKRAEFWEKLNQGAEPVTRKRVSEGIRKEKAKGPVTAFGKPYDLGKWGRGS